MAAPTRFRLAHALVLAALLALVPLTAPPSARADTCNDAYFWMWGYSQIFPQVVVHGAAWDTTTSLPFPLHAGYSRTERQGWFSASSGGRAFARLDLPERLDVTGVPPGTAVPCAFEMTVTGQSANNCGGSGCGVTGWITMFAGPDSAMVDLSLAGPGNGNPVNVSTTRSLPITLVAGSPLPVAFRIGYGTGPGAGAESVQLSFEYRVTGLPPGAGYTTCVEYAVTPVRHSTWGALKSIYR